MAPSRLADFLGILGFLYITWTTVHRLTHIDYCCNLLMFFSIKWQWTAMVIKSVVFYSSIDYLCWHFTTYVRTGAKGRWYFYMKKKSNVWDMYIWMPQVCLVMSKISAFAPQIHIFSATIEKCRYLEKAKWNRLLT